MKRISNGLIHLLLIALLSCESLSEDGLDRRNRDTFSFALVDSNYQNLVDSLIGPYYPDSVSITNSNGEVVSDTYFGQKYELSSIPNDSTRGWVFDFNFLQGQEVADLTEYEASFYLQLSNQDTDTIRVKGVSKYAVVVYLNGKQAGNRSDVPVYAQYYFIKYSNE